MKDTQLALVKKRFEEFLGRKIKVVKAYEDDEGEDKMEITFK